MTTEAGSTGLAGRLVDTADATGRVLTLPVFYACRRGRHGHRTGADGSAALSKDVLELTADGSATVLWSRLEFDRGGGDDGTKPRVEKGFSREVLRLPPAAALGPGGSLDEFWTRAAQHCGVVEVEIDGKLVYPF